jgi:hypothetical protein
MVKGEHGAVSILSQATPFESPDRVEEIGLALSEIHAAGDLGEAFDAVARHLAAAVGAHTALVAATGAEEGGAPVASGTAEAAAVLAMHPQTALAGDVVIRFVSGTDVGLPQGGRWCGMTTRFDEDGRSGVVLAVVPTRGDGAESVALASTMHTFGELARLCLVQAGDRQRFA